MGLRGLGSAITVRKLEVTGPVRVGGAILFGGGESTTARAEGRACVWAGGLACVVHRRVASLADSDRGFIENLSGSLPCTEARTRMLDSGSSERKRPHRLCAENDDWALG